MTNDDVWMEAVLSGEHTGRPRSDVIFVKPPVSWFLATAYETFPSVPWYGLVVTVAPVALFTTLLFITGRRVGSWGPSTFCLTGLTAFLFTPSLLLSPTFTTAATLLAVLSVALALTYATKLGPNGDKVLLVLIVLATVGTSIRTEAGLAVFLSLVPLIVISWIFGNCRKGSWKALLAILVGLGVLGGSMFFENKPQDLLDYQAFNEIRGQLHGSSRILPVLQNPEREDVQMMLSENGWAIDDIVIFLHWFFDDDQVFTTEKLERLIDTADGLDQATLGDGLSSVWEQRDLVLLMFGIVFYLLSRKNRSSPIPIVILLGWALVVFSYIGIERFPDRLALGLVVGICIGTTWVGGLLYSPVLVGEHLDCDPWKIRVVRLLNFGTALVTIAAPSALLFNALGPKAIHERNSSYITTLKSQLEGLKSVDQNGSFVIVGAALSFEGVDPLAPSLFDQNLLFTTGWPTFSPANEARKKALGIEKHLPSAILRSKSVYVVAGPGEVNLLTKYLDRRYTSATSVKVLAGFVNGAQVVKFQPSLNPE
jgi:hypothetical protein